MPYYILYESASGLALFEKKDSEEIGGQLDAVQEAILDYAKFSKAVQLKAFIPFISSEHALENINAISEGILTDFVKEFISNNIPKSKKNILGVAEEKLGSAIQEATQIKCEKTQNVLEYIRGIRFHFPTYLKNVAGDKIRVSDLANAQRGLGHSYSRAKVKFNVNKADNMIIQSISLLDQLDKDINTFAMRVREWYSWHFPELIKIVSDNIVYARIVTVLQSRSNASDELLPQLTDIIGDEQKAKEVLLAARTSMGTDISDIDMTSIQQFALRVVKLAEYRKNLQEYLYQRMHEVAPTLSTLIGETVGARLINHAGSLTNLAKYPASTVQILGAEKALFRALKTRGNTPKYGLIFNSTWIGKAKPRDKGRISRYLANKVSMAARIDSFYDTKPPLIFGEELKKQMEERLKFFETGEPPRKNIDVMQAAIAAANEAEPENGEAEAKDEMEVDQVEESEQSEKKQKKKKKKDKEKKDKDKKKKKKKEKSE